MKNKLCLPIVCLTAILLQGCYATKIVSAPMRVVGAVTSLVPYVGNAIDETIDIAADTVDDSL